MKQIIHPLNVSEGDIVEFTQPAFVLKTKTLIPVGTKARFVEWIEDGDVKHALASVTPLDMNPPISDQAWIRPNILVVEK